MVITASVRRFIAAAWCVVAAVSIGFSARSCFGTFPINTDISTILPLEDERLTILRATAEVSRAGESRVAFMAAGAPREKLESALRSVRESLTTFVSWEDLSADRMERIAASYLAHRGALLSSDAIASIEANDLDAVLDEARAPLYSSEAGYYSRYLSRDPLLIVSRFLRSRPSCFGGTPTGSGFVESTESGETSLLLVGTLSGSSLNQSFQERFIPAATSAMATAGTTFPGVSITPIGAIWFADRIGHAMQSEAQLVGTSALVLTTLLLVVVFRGLKAIALIMVPLVIGMSSAFAASLLFFPSIHAVTLALGSILIGGCSDYAIHYLTVDAACERDNRREETLSLVLGGLTIGMLTTVLSFLGLLLTPLPILQQLAVFAAAGLTSAYLTVIVWFPFLCRGWMNPTSAGSALVRAGAYLRPLGGVFDRMSLPGVYGPAKILAVLIGVSILALYNLESRDNLRLISPPQPDLLAAERLVSSRFSAPEPARFGVVTGGSDAERLSRTAEVLRLVRTPSLVATACGVTDWIPPLEQQLKSIDAATSVAQSVQYEAYRADIGLERNVSVVGEDGPLLPLPHLAPSHVPADMFRAHLDGDAWASVIRFVGIKNEAELAAAVSKIPGASFVDRVTALSTLLAEYRHRATYLTGGSYVVVAILLLARYGFRRGLLCMIPPAGGVAAAVCAVLLIGGGIHVFSLFALLLILGLGVDFAVFFLEDKGHDVPTLTAVAISATTSAISGGALAFCSTPILREFGIAVAVGILACFLLSPIVKAREGSASV